MRRVDTRTLLPAGKRTLGTSIAKAVPSRSQRLPSTLAKPRFCCYPAGKAGGRAALPLGGASSKATYDYPTATVSRGKSVSRAARAGESARLILRSPGLFHFPPG